MLGDTETTFSQVFSERGADYEEPTLVLFTDATQSACGVGQAAMGPFYCPADRKVYLDLSFFHELDQRFGAPGDFAQAYVVAHEVGHHIQTLTGLSQRVSARGSRRGEAEANALSVRQELQADCYAGVWGNYASQKGLLDPGDVEEGLRAAAAIGDDRLQRQTQGRVVARVVHARIVGAARVVAAARARKRTPGILRHVRAARINTTRSQIRLSLAQCWFCPSLRRGVDRRPRSRDCAVESGRDLAQLDRGSTRCTSAFLPKSIPAKRAWPPHPKPSRSSWPAAATP